MDWNQWWEILWVRVGAVMAGSLLVSAFAGAVFFRLVLRLTRGTDTDLDDRIAAYLRAPAVATPILLGTLWIVRMLELEPRLTFILSGIVKTSLVIVWGVAAPRAGDALLAAFAGAVDRFDWAQPKTLPVLQIVWKVVVFATVSYFALVAWELDLRSWLASAGVIGIAVGFAAKDTLANLFSGVFILADAPYKLGDFILLDDGLRGVVTDIGVRSTRLLTRDNIEVTVPNAVIGNSRIVNETGGPHQKMRVRVLVQAAYGSDIDKVREVLLASTEGIGNIATNPAPQVRFKGFGESGLDFQLRAWIEEPLFAGRVLDALHCRVYKSFDEAGLQIPFPQRVVQMKPAAEDPIGD